MKVFILLCLALSVWAENDEMFFTQLRDTEFGKTILQTIQLELKYFKSDRLLVETLTKC